MITVHSMKGGVGASTFASILAIAQAELGSVLLVDLSGDLPALLGLAPTDSEGVSDWAQVLDTAPDDAPLRLATLAAPQLNVLHRGTAQPSPSCVADLTDRLDALADTVIVDCGNIGEIARTAGSSRVDVGRTACDFRAGVAAAGSNRILVTRPCYLALRASSQATVLPTSVALIEEPGRTLGRDDVAAVVDAPVDFRLAVDPAIARLVDAGLLISRLPRSVRRSMQHGYDRAR